MFYCAPAAMGIDSPSQDPPASCGSHEQTAPDDAPEETIEKPHCESDDEAYYHLALAYNNPGEWRAVEDSLFIRATKLPTPRTMLCRKNQKRLRALENCGRRL